MTRRGCKEGEEEEEEEEKKEQGEVEVTQCRGWNVFRKLLAGGNDNVYSFFCVHTYYKSTSPSPWDDFTLTCGAFSTTVPAVAVAPPS
jgi:hypothetical protein